METRERLAKLAKQIFAATVYGTEQIIESSFVWNAKNYLWEFQEKEFLRKIKEAFKRAKTKPEKEEFLKELDKNASPVWSNSMRDTRPGWRDAGVDFRSAVRSFIRKNT